MAEASPQPQTSTADVPPPSGTASPPPNCAICLGNCINKCFSDSCMHQFCFKCLLEWSKVKAVCPLCKQPFTSIIHNVKSNNEYEEHFIVVDRNNLAEDDFDEHFIVRAPERRTGYDFFLPTVPTTSRHFQFRTTFTVDPRGELAIQQLLSTHPLTTSSYEYVSPINFHSSSRSRRRIHGDVSTTNFRRFIYAQDLWANSPPDITGRYRDISPQYYRDNQAAKTRIAPWLNRELNALLETTQPVMYLVDIILSQLSRHHVTSRYFKQLLAEYLHDKTEHFIHELYNFMRSPFPMISYDTQMFYIQGRPSPLSIHLSDNEESSSSDSDVAVVSVENTDPVVIEINSDSSRDSDVIIREPTPPVVVDLINTDSNDTIILPVKNKKKRRLEDISTNGFGSTRKLKLKRKHKKSKYYIVKEQSDSDSSDNEPLCIRLKRKKDERRRKKLRKLEKRRRSELKGCYNSKNDASTNTTFDYFKHENSDSEPTCPSYTPPPALPVLKDENLFTPGILGDSAPSHTVVTHKSEKVEEKCSVSALADNIINFNPGPSGSNVSPGNSWYLRPNIYGSSDDTSD